MLKIYEALFPHRAAPTQQNMQNQPMSMMDNSFNNSVHMMGGRSDQRSQGGVRTGVPFPQSSVNQSLNQSYNGPLQSMMAHQQFVQGQNPQQQPSGQDSQSMLPAIANGGMINSYN